jgi:hypothetical protein
VSPCCDFFSFFVIVYRFYNRPSAGSTATDPPCRPRRGRRGRRSAAALAGTWQRARPGAAAPPGLRCQPDGRSPGVRLQPLRKAQLTRLPPPAPSASVSSCSGRRCGCCRCACTCTTPSASIRGWTRTRRARSAARTPNRPRASAG